MTEYRKRIPYRSASVLFHDEQNKVLVGYHPYLSAYSAFGGKRQGHNDRHYFDTAFRELLEELFGWKIVPMYFIDQLVSHLDEYGDIEVHIKKSKGHKGHILILLTLVHLEVILRLCRNTNRTSKYYRSIPYTIKDLIHTRQTTPREEVTDLIMFDAQKHSFDSIDSLTRQDITELFKIQQRRIKQIETISK